MSAAGRPVVVTGASSGIGRATALAFAALGHPVVLGARRVERCEETAQEIRRAGGTASSVALDLRETDSIVAFAEAAVAALGRVDVLVSCAGDVLPETVVGTPPEDFAAQVQINLLGAQHLVSLIAPQMIGRREGDLVLVTSDVVRLSLIHI